VLREKLEAAVAEEALLEARLAHHDGLLRAAKDAVAAHRRAAKSGLVPPHLQAAVAQEGKARDRVVAERRVNRKTVWVCAP
jgi:hypothetical protein